MKQTLLLTLVSLFFAACILKTVSIQSAEIQKIDVVIDTDLGGDPDDIQSLFRLVHYSDFLNIRGIISTPDVGNPNHPWDTIPNTELIKTWIQRIDPDHLRSMGYVDLMSEQELISTVKEGAWGKKAPAPGLNTQGSDYLIELAKEYSTENPLWVLVWGAMTTFAQALHDDPSIAPNIRVYFIGSSNTLTDTLSRNYVYSFMENQYNELWWIENGTLPKFTHETFRGVYMGGQQEGEWGNIAFVDTNIRNHGSKRKGYFDEKCGDAFPVATWPQGTLKEGDSPTFMYLLSPAVGGIGNIDDPTQESWGGQFRLANPERFPNYYVDLDLPMEQCTATISKWRYDFMSHWKYRWDRYDVTAAEERLPEKSNHNNNQPE